MGENHGDAAGPVAKERSMTDRATSRVVGTLFLLATIAGLIGLPLQESVVGGDHDLSAVSAHSDRLATGVLLQLIMGIAVVSIAVVIYPVLRRHTERLAMGYVARNPSDELQPFARLRMHQLGSVGERRRNDREGCRHA